MTAATLYDLFRKQSERLLPKDTDYHETVSLPLQEDRLEKSGKAQHFENFFFVINNRSFQADQVYGAAQLLGYPDKTFTLKKFFSLIHPSHHVVLRAGLYELLETLLAGGQIIRFGNPLFVLNIALKHINGEYLLFKWLAFPFQADDKNKMLSCFNELTLISSYHDDICNLRVTGDNGRAVAWLHDLQARIKKRFREQALFSEKERLILLHYSSHPADTNASVAETFGIMISSVITYNKRILRKAEQMFVRRFKTAREVAGYLSKEKLL